jgi:hypothetical protein
MRETRVVNNKYAAAWVIVEACCETVVMAGVLGDSVIAQLAGAAALAAADFLGLPERELRRIQRIMASELEEARVRPRAHAKRGRRLRASAANENRVGAVRPLRCPRRPHVDERG